MLPTILFIIAAYGIYALVVAWCRRQNYRFQETRAKARPRWKTLAGGALILGATIWLIFWLTPDSQGQKVKLAGILGMTEGEALLASHATAQKPLPSLQQQQPGGEPVYAHLHPESPPTLSPPAKPSKGAKVCKPRGKQAYAPKANKQKVAPKRTTKGKAGKKVKAKKKKASTTSALRSPSSRGSSG